MNYLDIIIGIILILFALGGLKNGIIREAFSLAAFVGGIYGAVKLSDLVGKWLAQLINVNQEIMSVISFIIVFVALALLINWLGGKLADLISSIAVNIFFAVMHLSLSAASIFMIVNKRLLRSSTTAGQLGLKHLTLPYFDFSTLCGLCLLSTAVNFLPHDGHLFGIVIGVLAAVKAIIFGE